MPARQCVVERLGAKGREIGLVFNSGDAGFDRMAMMDIPWPGGIRSVRAAQNVVGAVLWIVRG